MALPLGLAFRFCCYWSMCWKILHWILLRGSPILTNNIRKYAHFISLRHPLPDASVAFIFLREVVRLHGCPKNSVIENCADYVKLQVAFKFCCYWSMCGKIFHWILLRGCPILTDITRKYAHFISRNHTFTDVSVAFIFLCEVVRLYGCRKGSVSDRDKIFTSLFWEELFWTMDPSCKEVYLPSSNW